MQYNVVMKDSGHGVQDLGYFVGADKAEAISAARKIYGGRAASYAARLDERVATEAELDAALENIISGSEIPWRIWTERGDKAVSSAMLIQYADKGLVRVKRGSLDTYGHDRWFKL